MKEIEVQQPATGKEFFDREEVLGKLIKGGQNISLIGVRKAGKTSILKQFLTVQNKFIASYYYIPFEETFDYFIFNFFNGIAFAYLKFKAKLLDVKEETPRGQFNQLLLQLKFIRPDLALYLNEVQNLDGQSRNKGYLRGTAKALFELPYLLISKEKPFDFAQGKQEFVVVLDEFQNTASFNGVIPDVLREKIQEKKGVYYYLAGSEIGLMEDMVGRYKTPLFGHFTNFRIGGFSYEDARQFILSQCKTRGLLINEGVLNFLVSLTGGFPFYIRVLIYEFFSLLTEEKREFIERKDIKTVLEKSLFSQQGRLYKYFEESIAVSLQRRRSGRFYQILKAIAGKETGITQIAQITGLRVTSIPTYLEGLLKTELVIKQKSKYLIKDTLMKFWLNAGLGVQESPVIDTQTKLDNFNQKIKEFFESLKTELGIAREAQIREIFILSGGYQRVRGGFIDGQELDIIAENAKGYLLGEIKSKNAVKEDITKFLDKIKKIKVKIGEMIFIALMGTEKEALELAKKEEVKVWDLAKVNQERQKYKLAALKL